MYRPLSESRTPPLYSGIFIKMACNMVGCATHLLENACTIPMVEFSSLMACMLRLGTLLGGFVKVKEAPLEKCKWWDIWRI